MKGILVAVFSSAMLFGCSGSTKNSSQSSTSLGTDVNAVSGLGDKLQIWKNNMIGKATYFKTGSSEQCLEIPADGSACQVYAKTFEGRLLSGSGTCTLEVLTPNCTVNGQKVDCVGLQARCSNNGASCFGNQTGGILPAIAVKKADSVTNTDIKTTYDAASIKTAGYCKSTFATTSTSTTSDTTTTTGGKDIVPPTSPTP